MKLEKWRKKNKAVVLFGVVVLGLLLYTQTNLFGQTVIQYRNDLGASTDGKYAHSIDLAPTRGDEYRVNYDPAVSTAMAGVQFALVSYSEWGQKTGGDYIPVINNWFLVYKYNGVVYSTDYLGQTVTSCCYEANNLKYVYSWGTPRENYWPVIPYNKASLEDSSMRVRDGSITASSISGKVYFNLPSELSQGSVTTTTIASGTTTSTLAPVCGVNCSMGEVSLWQKLIDWLRDILARIGVSEL